MAVEFRQWKGALAAAALAAALAACGKSEAPPAGASPAETGTATAPAGSGSVKPGYAVGKLTEESGGPIVAKDAKLTVSLWGISGKGGEKVYYTPQVNADGTYEQKLAEGAYAYDGAKIEVPFEGKHFIFDLEAVKNDSLDQVGADHLDRDSSKGIEQNYVWKVRGVRPGRDPDERLFTSWYGGSVTMQFTGYREDIRKAVAKGPVGSQCVFTLTPQGPLIDGHEGKELTFKREYDTTLPGLNNPNLPDIPVGSYSIKGWRWNRMGRTSRC
jgi:hypothetical protein